MRALISAFAVAGLFGIALPSHADGINDNLIDSGAVKSGSAPQKAGRTIEERTVKPGAPTDDPTMGGRSPFIEDGTVKSGGASSKPGRAVDDSKVKSGGATDKPRRAVDDGTVKSGSATEKPGRTADEQNATQNTKKVSKEVKTPAAAPTN